MSDEKKVSIPLSERDKKVVNLLRGKANESAAYQRGAQDTINAIFQQFLAMVAQDAGYQDVQLTLAKDDSALVGVDVVVEPPQK